MSYPLLSFDPYISAEQNQIIYHTLYSYLIDYNTNLQPSPDLAKSWDIASDHKSVTIHLNAAKFSDGTPVTANDVVEGIKRAQNPSTGLNQTGPASIIASAQAQDDHTVVITLTQPTSQDMILDWMSWFPIVEAAKDTAAQLQKAPAGSGPFMLDSYAPGNKLVLKKNPNYFQPGKPYLDQLVIKFFDDQQSLVSSLQSGGVDGSLYLDPQYESQVKGKFDVLQTFPGSLIYMLALNTTKPPFDNQACRQAVARAIDRTTMITTSQQGLGDAVPGPFGPTSPAFDASLLTSNGFDVATAKSGMSACSPASATIGIGKPGETTIAQVLQTDLKQAGFTLNISTMDSTTFKTKFHHGDVQAAINTTTAPFRSAADDLLGSLTTSIGKNNFLWGGKVPQTYVAAVKNLAAAVTDSDLAAANKQVNQTLSALAYFDGLMTDVEIVAVKKGVTGISLNPHNDLIATTAAITGGS